MKKLVSLTALLFLASATAFPLHAQTQGQGPRKSFDEFRRGILNDFSDFRSTIIDHYYDFLNGEWHEYESLNGEKRYTKPKPQTAPKAPSIPRKPNKKDDPVSVTPQEPVSRPERPKRTVKPEKPETPKEEPVVRRPAMPEQQPVDADKAPDAPKQPSRPSAASVDQFSFFELPMQFPQIEFNIRNRLTAPADYAAQWKELDKSGTASALLPQVRKVVKDTGLNDYLTFQLIKAYIDSKFPYADASSKMSAVHFFLANLGYDARIAMTASGVPLLLLPTSQTIYARNYMMMPGGAGKYYVFGPDGYDLARMSGEKILTCSLPADAAKGKRFDMKLGPLNIPVKPKSFEFAHGPLRLTGEVNENLMPILYRYPQIPVGDYAASELDPALRRALVEQVRSQLGGMDGDKAVGELLGFMHNVFQYATDEEFHGFEKPYFLEETLYYPKNDCEDRAIFYTYFLWNALGREAQLISFPGHEAATVRMDNPIDGTSYTYGTDTFYISDPTYLGSQTGMVMPMYRTETPKVDYTYK